VPKVPKVPKVKGGGFGSPPFFFCWLY